MYFIAGLFLSKASSRNLTEQVRFQSDVGAKGEPIERNPASSVVYQGGPNRCRELGEPIRVLPWTASVEIRSRSFHLLLRLDDAQAVLEEEIREDTDDSKIIWKKRDDQLRWPS